MTKLQFLLGLILVAGLACGGAELASGAMNSTSFDTSTQEVSRENTTLTSTTAKSTPKILNCPASCSCTPKRMDCSSRQLTQVPGIDKNMAFVEFILSNNSLTSIDFKQFLSVNIESLDLSDNKIRSIIPPQKKPNELTKLRSLDLSRNQLESLSNFSQWKMPVLEELSLAHNPIERINSTDFSTKPLIKKLQLQELTNLKSIDRTALNPLEGLSFLNLSSSVLSHHLPDQLFSKNQNIDLLDLSNNNLIEVPVALRSTNAINRLYLNGNAITSLRQSDFINRTELRYLSISNCSKLLRVDPYTFSGTPNLQKLVLSNNERLSEISIHAFERNTNDGDNLIDPVASSETALKLFDLSNNNLTTFSSEMPNLKILGQLRLTNNPWDCTCSLKWMLNAERILGQQLIHCSSPSKYKYLEISQVLPRLDCTVEEEKSLFQRFVIILVFMFFIVLVVATFAQRTEICRRLQWRDQYGTIYYTKSNFPAEQV